VTLTDEFGSGPVTVTRPLRLCNPSSVDGGGIKDPTAHLMCYRFAGDPVSRHFVVRNQFGTQAVRSTGSVGSLCLPAQKNMGPSFLNLDHYKCFKVRPMSRFEPRTVAVTDQFESKPFAVVRPLFLCTAVDKNDEGILDAACRLMCYRAVDRGQPRFVPQPVSIEDQFGRMERTVYDGECRKTEVLCVPSSPSPAFLDAG
jgi:hypothetical protein